MKLLLRSKSASHVKGTAPDNWSWLPMFSTLRRIISKATHPIGLFFRSSLGPITKPTGADHGKTRSVLFPRYGAYQPNDCARAPAAAARPPGRDLRNRRYRGTRARSR